MKKANHHYGHSLSWMRREKERTEIGGNPDMIQHYVPVFFRGNGYTVYTFTFEQDGHKYMVATSYKGGIARVEIKD